MGVLRVRIPDTLSRFVWNLVGDRVEFDGTTEDAQDDLIEFGRWSQEQPALQGAGGDLEGGVGSRHVSKRSSHVFALMQMVYHLD